MVENVIFYCLVEEKKKTENKGESFPSGPTFFILAIWDENGERKVLRNAFYTNTLSLTLHFIHDLMTFASSQQLALAYFIVSNVASFFFFFSF